MKFLQYIRRNKVVNRWIRKMLKESSKRSKGMFDFFIQKWSPSGIVDCQFEQYNFKYLSKCDDGVANYFYYNLPYYEKADLNLFIELSKKCEVIVDIGANTGLFSILSSKANPKAKIYAFEPYYVNCERMKINLRLNSANNVTIIDTALGEFDGQIKMSVPKNRSINEVSSINETFSKKVYPELLWDSHTIEIQTLDSYTKKNKIGRINLIKCDVETYEMSVFKGATNVLEYDKPTIIFECFFDEEKKAFFNEILTRYNYYLYLILEQGVVYCKEGMINTHFGVNYLISPVKPSMTYISYCQTEDLWNELLLVKP